MTPTELHRHLDTIAHALADFPPEAREPVDAVLCRIAGVFLTLHAESERRGERLAEGVLVRKLMEVWPC